jgi:predicted dienelactone hydrolase
VPVEAAVAESRRAQRIVKGLAALTLAGVLGVAALLASFWIERRAETTLPAPTGPFAVGRSTDIWTDPATVDTLAPVPGATRELLVWIWYPSAAGQSGATDDYIPARMRNAAGPPGGPMGLVTRDLSKVHGHSARDVGVAPQPQAFPVVIMRGGASAGVVGYSTLAEDLASHGYVVVGFDAPYRSNVVVFPDGRVARRTPENNPELCPAKDFDSCAGTLMTAWTADIAFALDRLEQLNRSDPSGKFMGRLDMARVGVFGHSLGGAQAAQFCHDDRRCKAGVDVDGEPLGSVVREGLHQPFMFLLSAQVESSDPDSRRVKADIQSIYDRLPPDARWLVEIQGANHFLFSDDGALLKSHIVLGALRAFGLVGIEGRRQLAVTTYCLRTFFDTYLEGTGVSRLNLTSPLYPEIRILDAAK